MTDEYHKYRALASLLLEMQCVVKKCICTEKELRQAYETWRADISLMSCVNHYHFSITDQGICVLNI